MGRGESNPGGFLRFLNSLSHFLFTNSPAVPAAPARLSGLPVIRQSICLVLLSSKGQPSCLHPKAEAPIRWSVSPLPLHQPALPLLCGNRYRHTHVPCQSESRQGRCYVTAWIPLGWRLCPPTLLSECRFL